MKDDGPTYFEVYDFTYSEGGGVDWLALLFIVLLTLWALSGIVWLALVTVTA